MKMLNIKIKGKDMKDEADGSILDELISACDSKIGGKFKPEEPEPEMENEDEDESELSTEDLAKLIAAYKAKK